MAPSSVLRHELDDAARDERPEQLPRAAPERRLRGLRLVAVAEQPLHRAAAVAAPAQHVQQHPVRHLEPRDQRLGRRSDQPLERVQVPVDEVVLGRLPLHDLLAVARGLLAQPDVLDDVLRRLDDDEAAVVEALAPGAPGDLVELAGAQVRRLLAVELAQAREQDRADRAR